MGVAIVCCWSGIYVYERPVNIEVEVSDNGTGSIVVVLFCKIS